MIVRLVYILVIFHLSCIVFAGNRLTIGALFSEENTDTELAFKYAIQWYNIYRSKGTFYKTNIQDVSSRNIYAASKQVCNMTNAANGVIAIFGPEALRIDSITRSICKKLEIPYIQISWQPSKITPPPIAINFYPSSDLLSEGYATILKHMNWKSYVIVYQHDAALMRLHEILKVPDVSDNPVMVRQLETDNDQRTMFKELKNSGVTKLVLDCDTDEIINILQQAKDMGMLNYQHSYFLTSLDAHTLNFTVLNTTSNMTMARIFDPSSENLARNIQTWEVGEQRHGNIITTRPESIRTEAVLMIDAANSLIEAVNQLLETAPIDSQSMDCFDTDTWRDGYRIAAYMKKHRLANPISGPIEFDDYGRRVNFTLYVVELNSDIIKATWSPSNGTLLNITISATERRQLILKSLQNNKIIVSTKLNDPYLMLDPNKTHSPDDLNSKYKGYAKDLMDHIANSRNFTYEFYLTADKSNGKFDEKTQTWSGIIGDILDGRAQLGISDLTVNHQRRQAVDFSNHFMTLGISILYKDPPAEDEDMFAFLGPLDKDVWMYTATAFLGVSVLLYLTARYSVEPDGVLMDIQSTTSTPSLRLAPGDWDNPHPCNENPEELENAWNIGNCLWLAMGSIMAQGCEILPKGISSRMTTAMWWFFSLLMTSSYTANLAAYISAGRKGPQINSVEDLVKQSRIKFGTMMNGTTYEFFKTSNYSTYERVWDKMNSFKPSTFVSDNDEGVYRVLNVNQEYAYFMESATMEYEINKHCALKQIGSRLDTKGYGIAMPINAAYRDEINDVLLELQESGTLQMLKIRWWQDLNEGEMCPKEDISQEEGLTLESVGGVFVVLCIGVAVAFFLAVAEFLWHVRTVSVQDHISYWQALKIESKFAVNLFITKKAVRPDLVDPPSSHNGSEPRSIAEKVMHGAGSFLHLENIFDRMSVHRND